MARIPNLGSKKNNELVKKTVQYLEQKLPVKATNGRIFDIKNIRVTDSPMRTSSASQLGMRSLTQEDYKHGRGDLFASVVGDIVITEKGETISSDESTTIIRVPIQTDRGTYIVDGNERTVMNLMKARPGVYTNPNRKGDIVTKLMVNPASSAKKIPRISIIINPSKGTFVFSVSRGSSSKKSVPGVSFMKALGFTDEEIRTALGTLADSVLSKSRQLGPSDVFNIVVGKNPKRTAAASIATELNGYLDGSLSFGEDGVDVVKHNIGVNSSSVNRKVIYESVRKTAKVAAGSEQPDDSQSLVYKSILGDNDFLYEKLTSEIDYMMKNAMKTITKIDFRKTGRGPASIDIGGIGNAGYRTKAFLKSGSMSDMVDQVNPLSNEATGRKITQLGSEAGALSKDSARGALENRNIHISQFGRIDPVETPESGKIGFQSHLAQSAAIKNRTITTKYLKVNNGVALNTAANTVELTAADEKNKVIAFYDTKNVRKSGNRLILKSGQVQARINGVEQMVASNRVTHMDVTPQNMFSTVSNMIPFVNHDDGNRVLMAANMQKQALDLVDKEAPLVSSAIAPGSKTTYEEKLGKELGKPVYAKVSGIVRNITNEEIIVASDKGGQSVPHKYYKYFPLNNGGFINNKIIVSAGTQVKKGQMLAEGWQTKDGKLAIGTNLRIGYMSYDGYNYEDGIVISENTAKKMRTFEVKNEEISVPEECIGGRGSKVLDFLGTGHADISELPDYIDEDGLVIEGTELKPGMIKAVYAEPMARPDETSDLLKSIVQGQWRMKRVMIPTTSYFKGTVQRVTGVQDPGDGDKAKAIYTVSTENNLKLGDKLAGRHGNKGTITKILADKDMPIAEDGKKLDILYSPLSIPSRKNVGQLLEANAGLIAEKTGKPFIVSNFDSKDRDRVIQGLKKIGVPDGKMSVNVFRDGKAVPVEDKITVGNAYIMKLNHKVDDKIQARSNLETNPTQKSNMPAKATRRSAGEKNNPQALGNMEVMALQGHSAAWNLLDSSTIKADGGGDAKRRVSIFNALKGGKDGWKSLEGDAQPETLKVYSDYLQGMGLKVTPYNAGRKTTLNDTFSSVGLSFLKSDEILNNIGKDNRIDSELSIASTTGRRTKKRDNSQQLIWNKKENSLADPNIFGDGKAPEDRKKWGYVELKSPMPNPILARDSSNPYSLLTGVNEKEFKSLMSSNSVLIVSPDKSPLYEEIFEGQAAERRVRAKMVMAQHGLKENSVVPTRKLMQIMDKDDVLIPWKVSGDAVNYLLKNIDLDKEIKDNAAKLKEPQKKVSVLDSLYKKQKVLLNLKKENKKPEDLMMKYVPVLPLHLRPIDDDIKTSSAKGDDLNYLYLNVIRSNNRSSVNAFKKDPAATIGMTPNIAGKDMSATWQSLNDLMGKSEVKRSNTGQPLQSISTRLGGKHGFIQSEMLSKTQDFSGRGVIGVDPELALDECKLPYDMARKLFEPMILKELRDSGVSKDDTESGILLDAKDPHAINIVKRVMADRPVILNRQPTLHKYGMLAFKPILDLDTSVGDIHSPARNIKINPLVVTPFNADFDGDQMAVHVPLTKRSVAEANSLLMPSSNIINTNTGRINFPLKGEMVAGLYEMTTRKSRTPDNGVARKYPGSESGWLKLKNDYLSGKDGMKITTKVDLPPFIGVSVGAALFDFCIPKQYRSEFAGITATAANLEKLQETYVKDAQKFKFEKQGYSQKDVADFYDKIKTLGLECSTRIGAAAISIQDFTKTIDKKTMAQIKRTATAEVKKEKQEEAKSLGQKFKWGLTNDNKINIENRVQSKIESVIKGPNSYLGEDNALYKMMTSKAKGNADQVRRMTVMVGAGIDVTGKRVKSVDHSNFEGMSTHEYFNHAKDSRKGMYDRSVGTSQPGEMTKVVGRTMQSSQIVSANCHTTEGIMMAKSSGAIEGRVLGEDVRSRQSGVESVLAKRDSLITPELATKMAKDETVPLMIKVRSPLRCRANNGVCQLCYGAKPGTRTLAPMGDPIGINATHALGEPITQMTMKTFHQGGTSTQVTQGMPALRNVLALKIDLNNPSKSIKFNKALSKAPKDPSKERHLAQEKMVSSLATIVGGSLQKTEDLGSIYKGVNIPVVSTPALDSRHLETIVGKLTSMGKIIDAGESGFANGSVRNATELDDWNAKNPTKRPIKYINDFQSYNRGYMGNENWMEHAAAGSVRSNLSNAASQGYIDKLESPNTRFMTGKLQRIGTGWNIYNKARNYANGISTNMQNIFAPVPNSVRNKIFGGKKKPTGFLGGIFGKKKK